jgi:membrane protease YdiL (CAAX protease family)
MTSQTVQDRRRSLLVAEFALLYLAAPLGHLIFFERLGLFGPLAAITAVGILLLSLTPGFAWRELVHVAPLRRWLPFVLAFALVTAAIVGALVMALVPERLLTFPRYRPQLWATIMVFYPLVSVLGQELFFRKLFYRRYAGLFGSGTLRIAVNAGVFGLAHAFYQNPVAIGLTAIAGVVFAWAYERSRSFPLVVLLHSLGGQIVFTLGLGVYFYHGAIG